MKGARRREEIGQILQERPASVEELRTSPRRVVVDDPP